MRYTTYFLTIALLIISCSNKQERKDPEKAIITGNILNFNNNSKIDYVTLIYFDFIESRKEILQNIDESGNFRIVIDNLYRSKEIWLGYGQILSFYIFPGDSLHFEIDSRCLEGYNGTGNHYSYYKVSGASETINTEIAAFKTVLEDSSFSTDYWNERSYAPVELSPNEYLAFSETDFKKSEKVAKTFVSKYSPSEEFKEWVGYHLKFSQWEDLLRYWWMYSSYNKLDEFEFLRNMPKSYFDFLKTWKVENMDYSKSIAYLQFLQEYYYYKNALFDSENYTKVITENGLNYHNDFDEISSLLYPGEEGLLLDILLAKRFSDSLEKKLDVVKDFIQIDYIKNAEVREKISAIYDQAEYLSGINKSFQINEEETDSFIKELIAKHPNKILYLDFWATWCGPCMRELPYSKKIKEYFNNDKVVFVYLANRCGETEWKETIEEREIKGDHYLLTDKQFSNMSKTFEINGIPHYALIDDNGNIIVKDAPRPSSGDDIINFINKLL